MKHSSFKMRKLFLKLSLEWSMKNHTCKRSISNPIVAYCNLQEGCCRSIGGAWYRVVVAGVKRFLCQDPKGVGFFYQP